MKSNLSVRFYQDTGKEKNGKSPIYLRIIYARKKAEHFTGIYLENKNWNPDKQRAKKDNLVNDKLSSIESALTNTLYLLEKENKLVSASILKDIYTGKNNLSHTLLDYFELHILDLKKANEIEVSTISRYRDTLEHLKRFLAEKKQTTLRLSKVDFKLLNDFDVFLKSQVSHITKQNLERNTVNKHHSRLRTIIIKANKEVLLDKNPYHEFRFKYTPSKRTFLTDSELNLLKSHDLANNASLLKVRDIFLFSVYTGLRFQDAQGVTTSQIIKSKKGEYYIDTIQSKTKESIKIPLLQPAIDIINKYERKQKFPEVYCLKSAIKK